MSVTMDNGQVSVDETDLNPKMESNDVGDVGVFVNPSTPPYVQELHTAPTERNATHYNMNHAERGKAIIFNHENFKGNYRDTRFGTNVDCKNLKSTFQELGFEVTDYHNLTHRDIVKNLERVASLDHSQHDCLVVVILSHGELGLLCAYDTRYKFDTICSYFTSDKCPSLAGKPKMFFIQACQGDKSDGGSLLKERTVTDGHAPTTTPTFRIPTHCDFLIAYSTIPGFYSWRNTTHGSWFMEALCMELRENGTRYDILTVLTFVSRRVAIDYHSYNEDDITMHLQKQIPCITSMLTRLVMFSPRSIAPPETNAIGNSK